MDNDLLIVIVIFGLAFVLLFGVVIGLFFVFYKKANKDNSKDFLVQQGKMEEKMDNMGSSIEKGVSASISQQMAEMFTNFNQSLNKGIDDKFTNITDSLNKSVSESFVQTDKTIKEVIERLTIIDETQKNLSNLSGDLTSLRNVLENNQARGKYGETQLEAILYNVFGEIKKAYKTKYELPGGAIPDAVVFLPPPNNLIAIDSKFPFAEYPILLEANKKSQEYAKALSKFKDACKHRIKEIEEKYIIPDVTVPWALMFVPSDGIFAFLHANLYKEVVEHGQRKNVIICSPSTLIAMLDTVRVFIIDYERSKNYEKMKNDLRILSDDFRRLNERWKKYNNYVRQAYEEGGRMDTSVKKISSRFNEITYESSAIEHIEDQTIDNIGESKLEDEED